MDLKSLVQFFDHTILKPESTQSQVEKIADEARECSFRTVCINSHWLPFVAKALQGSAAKPIAVVGFPLGACVTAAKAYETKWCIDHGAAEIDMVLNIGAFKDKQYDLVKNDISTVVKAADRRPVKVILETCYLQPDEIALATKLSAEAGAAFVKTSTGFGSRGASVDDIKTMKEALLSGGFKNVEIKASGGIRDLAGTMAMIEAGATRIGASASVAILQEFQTGKNSEKGKSGY
jgi:deoxyribose-phosphate aldolase